MPGQAYEARVWLVQHGPGGELPKKVTWSAGKKFAQQICDSIDNPKFCTSFHYWGPMLIQAQIEFDDGQIEDAYIYARIPTKEE